MEWSGFGTWWQHWCSLLLRSIDLQAVCWALMAPVCQWACTNSTSAMFYEQRLMYATSKLISNLLKQEVFWFQLKDFCKGIFSPFWWLLKSWQILMILPNQGASGLYSHQQKQRKGTFNFWNQLHCAHYSQYIRHWYTNAFYLFSWPTITNLHHQNVSSKGTFYICSPVCCYLFTQLLILRFPMKHSVVLFPNLIRPRKVYSLSKIKPGGNIQQK